MPKTSYNTKQINTFLAQTQKYKLEKVGKDVELKGIFKAVNNVKKMGESINKIIEATGLSREEIEEL